MIIRLPSRPASWLTTMILHLIFLAFLTAPVGAYRFHFADDPQQCGNTTVWWTTENGEAPRPPYRMLIVPLGALPGGMEIRTIHDISVDSGNSFSFTLRLPADSRFVAVMSDASGFGSGGTSIPLTVGSSSDRSCLSITQTTPQFYFYLNPTTPSQCGSIDVSWQAQAEGPVNVYAVIPGGQSFQMPGSGRGSPFEWTTNVREGTQMLFVAGDANGQGTGGSTDMLRVGSGSSDCLPDSGDGGSGGGGGGGGSGSGGGPYTATSDYIQPMPTTTSGSPTATGSGGTPGQTPTPTDGSGGDGTGTGTAGGTATRTPGSEGGTVSGSEPTETADSGSSRRRGPNIGAIIGGVLGGLALLTALIVLWFFLRSRRPPVRNSDDESEVEYSDTDLLRPHRRSGPSDPYSGALPTETLGSFYHTEPFVLPPPPPRPTAQRTQSMSQSPLNPARYTHPPFERAASSSRSVADAYDVLGAPIRPGLESDLSSGTRNSGTTGTGTGTGTFTGTGSASGNSSKSPLPSGLVRPSPPVQPTRPPMAPRLSSLGAASMYEIPPTYASLTRAGRRASQESSDQPRQPPLS